MASEEIKTDGLQPIVQKLLTKIKDESSDKENGWHQRFVKAVEQARSSGIVELERIKTLNDFIGFIDNLLTWVPTENIQGKDIYIHLCTFYFVFDQPAIIDLQSKIAPSDERQKLSWLSEWLVDYADAMGKFLDTPESLTEESLKTFRASPNYNMDEYLEPRTGWKTFNDLFARNFKPGYRPIAAISDPTVIVSPADSTFDGQWEIRADSGVTIKNIHWKISELLEDSPFKNEFNGGLFIHAFLGPSDYHRQHAPVNGKVVEARLIKGQAYLEVIPQKVDGTTSLVPKRQFHIDDETSDEVKTFDAPDTAGYQFVQMRGLVVLDTPIGLVAVLPMGMAQVSSVILTAEMGQFLRKGEEISYFQFGGSDIVVLFQARSNVSITAQLGTHYKVGNRIAQAYPEI